jgi:hypothetical protein
VIGDGELLIRDPTSSCDEWLNAGSGFESTCPRYRFTSGRQYILKKTSRFCRDKTEFLEIRILHSDSRFQPTASKFGQNRLQF